MRKWNAGFCGFLAQRHGGDYRGVTAIPENRKTSEKNENSETGIWKSHRILSFLSLFSLVLKSHTRMFPAFGIMDRRDGMQCPLCLSSLRVKDSQKNGGIPLIFALIFALARIRGMWYCTPRFSRNEAPQ